MRNANTHDALLGWRGTSGVCTEENITNDHVQAALRVNYNCVSFVKVKQLRETQLTATFLLDKHDYVAIKPHLNRVVGCF